jgi:NAD(P)-dependent dehydrogenase (short-subunit alcohol dehydrogenase family)
MSKILQGKRVLVTGGTTGIGQATAMLAAQAGADVAFCGLTEAGAADTLRAIEAAGQRAFFRALDLSDLDGARAFARDAIADLGGLDGLVNNAGNNFWHSIVGASYAQIQTCFQLNFYAAWAISQEAYPALKAAGGGMVVNLASIHGTRTSPGVFPYNVSKAMMSAMTQSMALEWAGDNIQAVAIAPGLIMTPLADLYFNQFDDPVAAQRQMERHYPLQRSGKPEDIGAMIVFLLSRQCSFITGETILIDGGLSIQAQSPEE